MGRIEEARKSLAWALEMDPAALPLGAPEGQKQPMSRLSDIFRYPRSLAVSWITNLGAQTGYYGLTLWVPTLLVQTPVSPARAGVLPVDLVNLAGLFGRVGLSYLSDAIGRKASGAIASFGAAILLVVAALYHDVFFGTVSLFWLILIVNNAFADGGFAIVGPYSAEVWPVALRTTGMGSAYGFGGLGKGDRPAGSRAHRGIFQHHHAKSVGRGAAAGLFLSGGLFRTGGFRVYFHWNGNEGPLARKD